MSGIKNYNKTIFQSLYWAYKPFLGRIFFVLLMGFIGRGMLLYNANLIGHWADTVAASPVTNIPANTRSNEQYMKIIFSLVGIGFLFTMSFRVIFSRLSAEAISRIYDETTLRTSRFPMGFFDKTPVGRVLTRFTSDYGNVFRLFGGPLAEFCSIIFDLIMMIILMSLANPLFLPIIVLMGITYGSIYRLNLPRLRQARRELSSARSPSIAHFAETAQGASIIRLFQKQNSFLDRFLSLDQFFINKKYHTSKTLTSFGIQMNGVSALFLFLTGGIAYVVKDSGLFTLGSIGIAFTFITMSSNTVQMFFDWLSQFEEAMVSLERLDRYLRSPLEFGAHLPRQAEFQTGHSLSPDHPAFKPELPAARVRFENVSFRYNENLPWILKDISFDIQPGECIGVIGRTGSGKSSLIQALFQFYPVEKGSIEISGQSPAKNCDLTSYRKNIAFISQDPILFKGSLSMNLDMTGRADARAMNHALIQVGLNHLVDQLNFRIEEKGKNLSLGERQLICLARCLLQASPLVIMDEATSSVDPLSEEKMNQATHDFFHDRTRILIAHRPTTLERCDRILWLDQGSIRMFGQPTEVISAFEKNGL